MASNNQLKALKGRVTAIKYRDPASLFTVFTLKPLKGSKSVPSISCVGEMETPPNNGDLVECFGYFENNKKYKGMQFKLTNFLIACGDDSLDIANFLISFTRYLGEEKASRIAEKFGSDVERILNEEPERLLEVEGIGGKVYENIVAGWRENRGIRSVTIFLKKLGLKDYQIKNILSHHGHEYEQVIKEDPYCLLSEGLGFSACDYLAEKMSIEPDSDVRFRGFVRSELRSQANSSGHLFLTKEQILAEFREYDESNHSRRFFSKSSANMEKVEEVIDYLKEEGFVVVDGDKVYDIKWFYYEAQSADHISRVLSNESAPAFSKIDPEEFFLNYEREERVLNPKFKLADQQKEAIESFIKEKMLVVTGGPGTGKTTIVKAFVKLLRQNNISYTLMAPTGVAAKRLGSATSSDAYTIHRRLGYRGEGSWTYSGINKLEVDVAIIDESSMVDQQLFFRAMDALRGRTKIVFVGDSFQLPSVGPGSVLHQIIDSGLVKTIMLEKIHRQSETSDIVTISQEIKEGNSELNGIGVNVTNKDVCFLGTGNDNEKAEQFLVKLAKSFAAKKKPGSFQVITPRNEGDLSVGSINSLLQKSLNPSKDKYGRDKKSISIAKDSHIIVGDRIIITKNNYNLGVHNGDIGKVLGITAQDLIVDIESTAEGESRVAIPLEKVRDMVKLAYAVTVHKCVPLETPVQTPCGSKMIKDLKPGQLVLSSKGVERKIVSVSPVVNKKSITLYTEAGQIKVSEDHKVQVVRGGKKVFIQCSEVKLGERLVFTRERESRSLGQDILVPTESVGKSKKISMPKSVDSDLAWLIGALIGDGSVSEEKPDYAVWFHKPSSPEVVEKVRSIVSSYGINVSTRKECTGSLYWFSKIFRETLEKLGLGYCRARDKDIPEWVFSSKEELQLSMLAGIIDTDGCTKNGKLRITTSSKKLSSSLQRLLGNFGVGSRVSYAEKTDSYQIAVSGLDYSFLSSNVIPTVNPSKKSSSLGVKSNWDGLLLGDSAVEDLWKAACLVPKRKGSVEIRKFREAYNKCQKGINKKISIPVARNAYYSLLEKSPHTFKEETDIVFYANQSFPSVTGIEHGKREPMLDIEVEEDHDFLINGFVVHNSQGMEYPAVIIPLIKSHGRMLLQRNLVYTALTRAKKKVIFIGQSIALRMAIENSTQNNRNTVLGDRIKHSIEVSESIKPLLDIKRGCENQKQVDLLLLNNGRRSPEPEDDGVY
jgi:exodeoxyribonuclease V alpha subunit